MTLSLGGHPQPFLRSAEGSVREVGQPGSAVGLLDRGGQWSDEHLTLAAGNILVLYTDGLTDVRDPVTGELAGDLIAQVREESHVLHDAIEDIAVQHQVPTAGGFEHVILH